MVNLALAEDYIKRAKLRLKVLEEFFKEEDYADVIRISQEIVELAQKAMLILINISPPKWHDVIDILIANKEKLPEEVAQAIIKLRRGAKWLRSQREIAFYGDLDFIPTRDYSKKEALKALELAQKFLKLAEKLQR